MFEITLKPDEDIMRQMYEVMYGIAERVAEDHDRLGGLPYLLSRTELAKHVFNVSPQTLDNHIVNRSDFPKVRVGTRVLYPKSEVVKWIQAHIEVVDDVADQRYIGIV